MSLKFPMKGAEMQSLYTMAWNGKPVGAVSSADPMFSGYQADEGQVEDESTVEVLAAPMTVRAEGEPTVEEMGWLRKRKFWQAQRVMDLFRMGYTDL
jgi:hypothetical protein